ncbi:aminopeptidase N-like [Topomyia yanbarensis]|uniref:aminopeptidase N-like n=1 Tax=Topomyia yanbarensis TaxID=2498891 RepID=UPI00273C2C59|nr:aminopeptidase N-like [Topomyia yanbarensis]
MVTKHIIISAVFAFFTISAQRIRLDRHNLPMHEIGREANVRAAKSNFESFRLPNTSVPIHYDLFLDTNVNLNDPTFIGNVQIQLTILENTSQIVLHSSHNSINNVQLFNSNQLQLALVNTEPVIEREFLVINSKTTLAAGSNYRLVIDFSGKLRDDLLGFYRSSYVDSAGSRQYIAVTQFEPSYARSAFPCYDEPGYRSTFSISISCGTNYKATSNMPIVGITIQPNQKKLTRFHMTPRMPTYLVAFMITDFVNKRVVLKEPTKLTMEILARSTASSQLELGLQKGVDAIRAIERYCNQTYGLPKLDQVAVPDFFFGAMENWGLVKYAEQYLLFDEETSSNQDKENVIITIVHELVHQFFGNLVTPKWWTDIFLSEGFATLYEYYIGADVESSIRFKELFVVEALQTAFYVDSLGSSRPLSYFVETNAISLFDIIAYQKGGSIFRMMNHALGEQTFQKGIRRYLEMNQNSAVDVYDLFESLQSVAKDVIPPTTTVEAIMSPWIFQSGYPVVSVQRVADSDALIFKQEHFARDPTALRTWWIPVSYRLSSQGDRDDTETVFWMPQGVSQLSIELYTPPESYLLVNPHQTGFYRVNYDTELWQRLIKQLNVDHTVIPPVSRAQLIDDSIKLVQAGKLDTATSFELIKYLQHETDYIPWYTAFASDNIQYINNGLVVDQQAYRALQKFLSSLTNNLLQRVGFAEVSNEPHEHQRLRAMAIEWNCRMGAAICRAAAHQLMTAELEGIQRLPSYIRHSIYCGGLMDATVEEFVAVFRTFQAASDLTERSMYISALGCNENSDFLFDYLTVTLDGGQDIRLRTGEWLKIFKSVYSRNTVGYQTFLRWLQSYAENILQRFGNNQEFLLILADISSREDELNQFNELIDLLQNFNPWHSQQLILDRIGSIAVDYQSCRDYLPDNSHLPTR